MNFYETRDLVAVGRPLAYDGAERQPGERFRPLSQIDADYLVSRGRAKVAPDDAPPPAAPVAAPVPPIADTPPPAADQVAEPDRIISEAASKAAIHALRAAPPVTTQLRRRGRPTNAERAAAAAAAGTDESGGA